MASSAIEAMASHACINYTCLGALMGCGCVAGALPREGAVG